MNFPLRIREPKTRTWREQGGEIKRESWLTYFSLTGATYDLEALLLRFQEPHSLDEMKIDGLSSLKRKGATKRWIAAKPPACSSLEALKVSDDMSDQESLSTALGESFHGWASLINVLITLDNGIYRVRI